MDNLLFALISLAMRWLEPRHNAQLQFLREQIRILRARVDAERIVPTPSERAELLRIGALLDHEVTVLDAKFGRPKNGWTNKSAIIAIARMGGYLNRKSDGPPGWLSIWRGWPMLMMMTEGARLATTQQTYG